MAKVATFKQEGFEGGEPIGPVYVIDPDNPPIPVWQRQPGEDADEASKIEVYEWMSLSQAREMAAQQGWTLEVE